MTLCRRQRRGYQHSVREAVVGAGFGRVWRRVFKVHGIAVVPLAGVSTTPLGIAGNVHAFSDLRLIRLNQPDPGRRRPVGHRQKAVGRCSGVGLAHNGEAVWSGSVDRRHVLRADPARQAPADRHLHDQQRRQDPPGHEPVLAVVGGVEDGHGHEGAPAAAAAEDEEEGEGGPTVEEGGVGLDARLALVFHVLAPLLSQAHVGVRVVHSAAGRHGAGSVEAGRWLCTTSLAATVSCRPCRLFLGERNRCETSKTTL